MRVEMDRVLATLLLVFIANVVSNKVNRMRCANGVWEVDRCACEENFVGERCQRPMHCYSFLRNENGSCTSCKKWWDGPNCDLIVCNEEYGTPTEDLLMCECTAPFTGEHCEILTTERVYYHYNRMIAMWGPIGAISIIPMVICFFVCNFFEKRRHVKRIGRALADPDIEYSDNFDSEVFDNIFGSDSKCSSPLLLRSKLSISRMEQAWKRLSGGSGVIVAKQQQVENNPATNFQRTSASS